MTPEGVDEKTLKERVTESLASTGQFNSELSLDEAVELIRAEFVYQAKNTQPEPNIEKLTVSVTQTDKDGVKVDLNTTMKVFIVRVGFRVIAQLDSTRRALGDKGPHLDTMSFQKTEGQEFLGQKEEDEMLEFFRTLDDAALHYVHGAVEGEGIEVGRSSLFLVDGKFIMDVASGSQGSAGQQ